MRWRERRHCAHSRLRGIYGDEINHTPGYRRLQCRDCGRLLDGPVMLALVRAGEEELRAHQPSEPDPEPLTPHTKETPE